MLHVLDDSLYPQPFGARFGHDESQESQPDTCSERSWGAVTKNPAKNISGSQRF